MSTTFTRYIFLFAVLCESLFEGSCRADVESKDSNQECETQGGSLLALSHRVRARPASREAWQDDFHSTDFTTVAAGGGLEKVSDHGSKFLMEDYLDHSESGTNDGVRAFVALQTRTRGTPIGRLSKVIHMPFGGESHGDLLSATDDTGNINLDCHYAFSARTSPIYINCPVACQYLAEVTTTGTCMFQCVAPQECGNLSKVSPADSVIDSLDHVCRKCFVPGCMKCEDGTNMDRCAMCEHGYALDPASGQCRIPLKTAVIIICSVVGVILLVLVVWYLELLTRPIVNREGVLDGLAHRSRSKLHMPKEASSRSGDVSDRPGDRREVWPLSTNIMATNVAGPGLSLFFNFQFAVLMWGILLAICWGITGLSIDTQLFNLGLLTIKTPQQACSVTQWGHTQQMRQMHGKTIFLTAVYLGTFFLSIFHAIHQRRRLRRLEEAATMADYAALISGLPHTLGSEPLEQQLQDLIEQSLGVNVVGVSVCWDYQDHAGVLRQTLEKDLKDSHRGSAAAKNSWRKLKHKSKTLSSTGSSALGTQASGELSGQKKGGARLLFCKKIDQIFGFGCPLEPQMAQGSDAQENLQVQSILGTLKCTGQAFVVFQTEGERDHAVCKATPEGSLQIDGRELKLSAVHCEPDTVIWESLTSKERWLVCRILAGIACVLLALILWGACFYLPYAKYLCAFTYAKGETPGMVVGMSFTLLVVAGNQVMYFVCGMVAESVGFMFTDYVQSLYIVLYCISCLLNVVLDLAITAQTSFWMLAAQGARSYEGQLLTDMDNYKGIFESYRMQKMLGSQLFKYSFPSCFLLPFILEPFFAIIIPYHLCKLLLGSYRGIAGEEAEKSLAIFAPMDLGRYADILLNMMLMVLCFFFPSGFLLKMVVCFVVSHTYIVLYDQYRVLRAVPSFHYANDSMDMCANALIAIVCGIILMALVFKASSCEDGQECIEGDSVVVRCVFAFIIHIAVHWALLLVLVPYFGEPQGQNQNTVKFEKLAETIPATWFSANPIYCLRSRYIFKEEPSCSPRVIGKEHLMVKNPKAKSYFQDIAASAETTR